MPRCDYGVGLRSNFAAWKCHIKTLRHFGCFWTFSVISLVLIWLVLKQMWFKLLTWKRCVRISPWKLFAPVAIEQVRTVCTKTRFPY